VVLLGEMKGSGYRTPPSLARRVDGQTVELTPLLYAVLAAADGQRSTAEIAASVGRATGRTVTAGNVEVLLDKLRPLGLLADRAGEGAAARANPLLRLRFKVAVSDPDRTRRLTAPFARLFHPLVVAPLLLVFVWTCWWVLFRKGLASATHDAFATPGLLLLVLAVTVLSAGFHEFGHAAAARRGGATPGVMGAGLYLIWPAFYTDVTDSYRLGRVGRLRTDLGGLYFNAIVTVASLGAWWVSQYDALLLLVATQILQMARQLLPFVRFDGYHVLADLTGVPDLFQRIGPTLKALVPGLAPSPAAGALKAWARAVITLWVLTVVPLLGTMLLLLVLTLPRVVGTALASAEQQREAFGIAVGNGDLVEAAARAVAMVVVALPVLATAYLLARVGRQVGTSVWRRTRGRPVRRAGAGLLAGALVAGLAWAWWPSEDRYRPVEAWESGRITDALSLARPASGFTVGSQGRGMIALPAGADPPTRDHPQLAIVLVPSGGQASPDSDAGAQPHPTSGAGSQGGTTQSGAGLAQGQVADADTDTWVFPFNQPLAPDADDNQALAVATTDGATTYTVAFALIWADGDDPVQTTNEAYALAHCRACAAVAVAFQVVLVVNDAAAVAPENISVAVNYDCTSCLTFALAVQLFVTLDGPLSQAATARIEELWQQVLAFSEDIGSVPLDEIQDTLAGFEEQILQIVEDDQGPLVEPSEGASPSAPESSTLTSSPAPTGGSDAATPTGSTSASDSSSPAPSSSGADAPSSTATEPTSASATSSASPTESPSGSPSEGSSPAPESSASAASDRPSS